VSCRFKGEEEHVLTCSRVHVPSTGSRANEWEAESGVGRLSAALVGDWVNTAISLTIPCQNRRKRQMKRKMQRNRKIKRNFPFIIPLITTP